MSTSCFPVRAKYLVAIWIGLEVLNGVLGTQNGVAHFAHLGGAAVGFLYMAVDLGMIPLREWTISFKGEESLPFSGASRARKPGEEVRDAKFYDISTGRPMDNKKDDVGRMSSMRSWTRSVPAGIKACPTKRNGS